MFTGLVGLIAKGCEFRDETKDRLTGLERDWAAMREIDLQQTLRLDQLDKVVGEKARYLVEQLEEINDRLDTMRPPEPGPPHRRRP